MPFIAIDFEASCLPQYGRSFPIEVGIATDFGWSRSWLIKPHASWRDWQWSEEAETLHGISRERLAREGMDVAEVARHLRAAVGGYEVIADSYFDDEWSRVLFRAAGEPDHVAVRCLADLRAFHDIDPERLHRAMAEADMQRARRHRAEDDARWLARLLGELGLEGAMSTYAPPARSIWQGELISAP
ncbi:hypothetical protein SLG_29510 [Sphingobium sp. SYK-6]|uniref:3'-5' exonuclease n=1 Tax=Sphingobium sp. (strain NBRC 103272 / SYK-6) TaxID=627192 RepID=UPI00022772F3|nr:exonuclease domain-containing protein [Sphingobium sp. SYK-6]BAK67626.1 hypothetical protein SLG_29510 [Sphingobium sp. SYK-6]